MEIKSKSPDQTQQIACDLAETLESPTVVAIFGDLGSGKTVFVKGLAKGLGIKKRILSPTFVFMRSYPFIKNNRTMIFHHLDLYRLNKNGPQNLGIDEIFLENSIVAIEWADRLRKLPKKRIDVYLKNIDEHTRKITIAGN